MVEKMTSVDASSSPGNGGGGGGGGGEAGETTPLVPEMEGAPGEATLLVSEFPPPPFYYRNYFLNPSPPPSSTTITTANLLSPPPIPHDALERGTRRAAEAAEKARIESERLRNLECGITVINQDSILAGTAQPTVSSTITTTTTTSTTTTTPAAVAATAVPANTTTTTTNNNNNINHNRNAVKEKDDNDDDDNDAVVAVFGEIVEDPLLVRPVDTCPDPKIVRDQVKRLNNMAVNGFVQLVQDLVHRPMENKKTRDELSHNIFLMLQECNKFREHQARETLIELLEKQLEARKNLVVELRASLADVDQILQN